MVQPLSRAAALSSTKASNPTLHMDSRAPPPYTWAMARDRFSKLRWVISTPFGVPVKSTSPGRSSQ